MVGQAATAIPLTEPVSVQQQKTEVNAAVSDQPEDVNAELSGAAAQSAMKIQQKYVEERQK